MQYSTIFLAAAAASGAFAAPAPQANNAEPTADATTTNSNLRPDPASLPPKGGLRITFGDFAPSDVQKFDATKDVEFALNFQTESDRVNKVALAFGDDAVDVRCQLLDDKDRQVVMTRKENTDINFSKGNPWTFVKPAMLKKLKCGPSFKKTDQTTINDITVTFSQGAKPLGEPVKFDEGKLPDTKDLAKEMYAQADTLSLRVGLALQKYDDFVKDLRCKAFDGQGKEIIVSRGANIDFSFSDGGEAKPWTFSNGPSDVTRVTCDPAFQKGDARDQVKKQPIDGDEVRTLETPAAEEGAPQSATGDAPVIMQI